MNIWSALAWVADSIESVFRKLAGVSTDGEIHDMATEIINHNMVRVIFNNLVAVSAALLIFFTIVKILQQQYKEKQGGNPYIIVFRMFKGMMMFFFVTAAVLVGLYASGVVFRALDDATSNGDSQSIGGKIFTAMAYDANRLRIGDPGNEKKYETAEAYYYARVAGLEYDGGDGQKYVMVDLTGTDGLTAAEAQAWYNSLGVSNWSVVNADGSTTPLRTALSNEDFNTEKGKPDFSGAIAGLGGNKYQDGYNDGKGRVKGAAGYQNDILTAIDTKIQPAIDVEWSPIAIKETTYALRAVGDTIPTNIQMSVMGNMINIPAGYQYVKYECEQPYTKVAISEANMFSINLNGRAALQGGEASASFDLDAYVTDLPVEKIMATLLVNNLLCLLLEKLMGDLPKMPLWFYIGPVSFNLISLAKTLCNPFIEALLNATLYTLTAGSVESADEFIKIGQGNAMPITWRWYDLFDEENWEDLWSQIADDFAEMKSQIMDSYEDDDAHLQQAVKQVDELTNTVEREKAWVQYNGLVQSYNIKFANLLSKLISNLDLFEDDHFINEDANIRDSIIEAIESDWRTLVQEYAYFKALCSTEKPSGRDAPTAFGQIYLPAFETGYTITQANQMRAVDIATEFKEGKKSSFNLVKNPSGVNPGVYNVVDWSVYTSDIRNAHNGIADVYTNTPPKPYMSSAALTPANFTLGMSFITSRKNIVKDNTFSPSSLQAAASLGAESTVDAYTLAAQGTTAEQRAAGDALWQELVAKTKAAKAEKAQGELGTADDSGLTLTTSGSYAGRDVMVFRKTGSELNASAGNNSTEEAKALKTWVRKSDMAKFADGARIQPIYSMSANDVDSYMATRKGRRYIMLAEANNAYSESGITTYIGQMSYQDDSVLGALYELKKINYVIGYIGIVVALGVYMNFTFGLIQRAVNLAVLYIMSPITISFYPFDDGQRFKNSFITPFYKEAISAYAIIISLNIFIVLLTPVKSAAASVAGSFMGTIALIAFTSMLPKIRDSITNILGASSIQQKSLTDMFKDAGNTLSDPWRQAQGLGKMAAEKARPVGKFASGVRDRAFMKAADRRQKRDEALAELRKKDPNSLNWLEKRKLERADARAIKDANRKFRMDKALNGRKDGKWDDSYYNLSWSEKREANRLAKAAEGKAKNDLADLRNKAKNGTAEEKAAARARLDDLAARAKKTGKSQADLLKDDLLQDEKYKESVNRPIVTKARAVKQAIADSKFVGGVKAVAGKVSDAAGKVSDAAKAAAGQAKAAGKFLSNTAPFALATDAMETLFHPATGMIAESKGVIGDLIRWSQPGAQMKRVKEMAQKEAEWRSFRYEVDENKSKQLTAASEGILQAQQSERDSIKRVAAQMQVAEMAKQGKVKSADQAEMVDNLVREINGAQIEEKYMQAAEQKWNETKRNTNVEDLKASRKGLSAEKKASVSAMVADIAKGLNLSAEQAKGLDKVIVDAVDAGDTMETITGKIMGHLPAGTVKEDVVKKQLETTGFAAKVNKMQFDLGSENTLVNGLLQYNKKMAKAREWAYQDLNIDIDSSAFQNFFQSYRQMFDQNLKGGLIDQENQLRIKYNGDTSSAAYQRELNALEEKFSKDYDRAFRSIGNDNEIRMYDYSVREMERQQAERVNVVAKQYQKRMRYQLDVNMSPTAKNVMVMDSTLQDMKVNGDYTGVAQKLDAACEAAIKKDWGALHASGLNQQTITQLEAWGNAGESGLKELRSIMDYNDLTRKFLGNADGISGGNSTQAVRNQMAAIFSVMETKEATEHLNTMLKAFAGQEGSIRAQLAQFHKDIPNDFVGSTWQSAIDIMDLRDQFGNKVTDLGNYVNDVVTRLEQKTLAQDSEELTNLVNKLSLLEGEWGTHEELKAIPANQASSHLTKTLKALNQVQLANEYSAKQIELHGQISKMNSGLFEISEKLEEKKK